MGLQDRQCSCGGKRVPFRGLLHRVAGRILELHAPEEKQTMNGFVPEMIQSDEEGFLVAPSVVRADHEARQQVIENKDRVCSVEVGFVVYKSTELN
jgi:hypothetical protein